MPPLQNWFPLLPGNLPEILITIAGLMGAITLSYAALLEVERRQDAVFLLASASLFVYSAFINDRLLMFAFALLFIISLRELIQIVRGRHHHTTEEIKKYEHPEQK